MQKNLWKGLFRPENKKLRSNIFLALLAGVLLLAMGKSTIAQDEVREESERDGKFRVEQKAVLTEEKGGNTAPFILSENAPVIEGVVIVAEGGGDATVQAALHQAAEALCNVPAHKIAVLQMK